MDVLSFTVFAVSSLFAVIDPLGCIPFFSGLTSAMDGRRKRRVLARALAVTFGVLLVFTWLGHHLLELFGITVDAFRIAGGVIFFGIGLDMLKSQPRRWRTGINSAYADDREAEETAAAQAAANAAGINGAVVERVGNEVVVDADAEDPSITPLAIPLLAGPGSITTVMVLRAQADSPLGGILVTAAVAVILLLTGFILAGADRVLQRLGSTGLRIIEKLMGLLVTVIAVQLIIDGTVPVVRTILDRVG